MIRFFAALLCTLLPLAAWAQTPGAIPDETLMASLKEKADTVQRVACVFTQEKHLAMFEEVLVSKGRFAFEKPDKLRWQYEDPFKSGFFLSGQSGREWDEASGKDRGFTLDNAPAMSMLARQIMAWATFDREWLEGQYDMRVTSEAPAVFLLTPKDEGAQGFLSHMIIRFLPDGSALELLELHEADGDFTRVIFETPEVNGELPASTFTKVP